MRRVFLLLMLALAPLVASATAPTADVIYIDGQEWWLMARPLDRIDSAHWADFYSKLPEDRTRSTGNWGGYTCYWSLDGEWLVLDSVVYEVWDSVRVKVYNFDIDSAWVPVERPLTLPQTIILEAFKDYCRDGKIVATWFTDTVRAVQGEILYRGDLGWDRFLDTETVIVLEKGHVIKRTRYHNRLLVDGFDFNCSVGQWREFQNGFLPILYKHPELDTNDRIIFALREGVVDSSGTLVDIQVSLWPHSEEDSFTELIVNEFKQYLMDIRPWKVYLINGDLFTPLKLGATISFSLKR